jgi:8-oxo-dGTP pyrophosphatase MutT (NUDIX family)
MNKIPLFERDYFGKVGAGILPICKSTGRVLIGLRSEDVNEPFTYGAFGGKVSDPDDEEADYEGEITPELILHTAKIELMQETGFDGDIELIKAYVFKSAEFEYHNFFGIVEEEFEPVLNWENDIAEWVTLSQLQALRPKHFGLKSLLLHSGNTLKKLLA